MSILVYSLKLDKCKVSLKERDSVVLCGDNKLANSCTDLLGFNPKGDHYIALANDWVLLTHLVAQKQLDNQVIRVVTINQDVDTIC